MDKREDRLRRQFKAIERSAPIGGRTLYALQDARYRLVRIPLAVLLILAGLLGFLPILGFWMIAPGLLLLAVDIPILRPSTSAAIIRLRRRTLLWRRRWRQWRAR